MAEEEEQLRMSRLLAADDIAYRRQLEEAVRECFLFGLFSKICTEFHCLTASSYLLKSASNLHIYISGYRGHVPYHHRSGGGDSKL